MITHDFTVYSRGQSIDVVARENSFAARGESSTTPHRRRAPFTSRREPAAGFFSFSKYGYHDHVHGGARDARGRRPVQVGGDPEGFLRSRRGGLQGVRRRRVLGDVAVRPHQGARPEHLRCVPLP